MKYTIVLLFFSYTLFGQNDCNLIKAAINSEQLQKHFSLSKEDKVPLIIIDTNRNFKDDCYFLIGNNREVMITNTWPDSLKLFAGFTSRANCKKLILYKITKGASTILQFIQPCSNANIILELITRKNKLKVKVIDQGVF